LEVVNEQEEDTSKPTAKKKQKAKPKQPKGKGKKVCFFSPELLTVSGY